MNKQAFLIMYHNDYYILERLLKQIDSENFDIYLHVDKKVKNFDFEYTKKILKKSKIYFILLFYYINLIILYMEHYDHFIFNYLFVIFFYVLIIFVF